MLNNLTARRVTVNDNGLWAKYAEAQWRAFEGKRLIAEEFAASIRGLGRRVRHCLGIGRRRHSPPI